jgi:hypothetical protein
MRLIVGISLLLLGVGTLSCRVESAVSSATPPALEWVRTAQGWERPALWSAVPVPTPRLHPLVVALGQGLFSIWALTAFREESE